MKAIDYIVITGSEGFIGVNLVNFLNSMGVKKLILVDDFASKMRNKIDYQNHILIDRGVFFKNELFIYDKITHFIHLGANTDTQELNYDAFKYYNLEYSKKVWQFCVDRKISLIYASSAATYGTMTMTFDDDHEAIHSLSPLNPYAVSKNEFDKWALSQKESPKEWLGLKFFNVYGPHESHKNRMASMVYHAYNQIAKTGKVKLFRSYRRDFDNGDQKRDFIYVKDIVEILYWAMLNGIDSNGVYNLGTGYARSFNELVNIVFANLESEPNIEYIDVPKELETRYQYFTQAKMDKFRRELKYQGAFTSLEEGVNDYLYNHLIPSSSQI